jgi:hypothetical protein
MDREQDDSFVDLSIFEHMDAPSIVVDWNIIVAVVRKDAELLIDCIQAVVMTEGMDFGRTVVQVDDFVVTSRVVT